MTIEKIDRLKEGYDEIDTLVMVIDKINEIIGRVNGNSSNTHVEHMKF